MAITIDTPSASDLLAEGCLTLGEVADVLGTSVRTVQRLVASGRLRKLPLGRLVRVTPAELQRLLEGRSHPADPFENSV